MPSSPASPKPLTLAQMYRILIDTGAARNSPVVDIALAEEFFTRRVLRLTGHRISTPAQVANHFGSQIAHAIFEMSRTRVTVDGALRKRPHVKTPETIKEAEDLTREVEALGGEAAYKVAVEADTASALCASAGLDIDPRSAKALLDVCAALATCNAVATGRRDGSPDAFEELATHVPAALREFDLASAGSPGLTAATPTSTPE